MGDHRSTGYLHDNDAKFPSSSAIFETKESLHGKYRVLMAYSAGSNRTKSVKINIEHAEGTSVIDVDQTKQPDQKPWLELGTFRWDGTKPGRITISNEGTKGHVVLDAFQWLPAETR